MSTESINWQQIDCLIWDLDGTLVDSVMDLAASVNHVLQSIDAAPLTQQQVRGMVGNGVGKLLDRAVAAAGADGVCSSEELYRRFSEHYALHCCDETVCFDGVIGTLQVLHDRAYVQGICTNKPEAMANTVCRELGLNRYIVATVGGDTTEYRKPHPMPMQHCLDQLGKSAKTALMIGDSAADVAAARSVDMPVVVLPWGYTQQPADQLGADLVLQNVEALSGYLPGQR